MAERAAYRALGGLGSLGVLLFATTAMPLQAATTGSEAWDFQVTLDGQPIGEHRFDLSISGDQRKLVSQAHFVVKFLGITAYRYRHKAVEQWQGDCLSGLPRPTTTARPCGCRQKAAPMACGWTPPPAPRLRCCRGA
jgi:Family of unknown function (DUF6134)